MGRVDGWMNPPRNEWLREDTREVGDGNARRFWKTGLRDRLARRDAAGVRRTDQAIVDL